MNRISTGFLTLGFALSLGAAAFAQAAPAAAPSAAPAMASHAPAMSSHSMSGMKMTKHTCPAGETYVKSYTSKTGTKVKGYCRKAGAGK